MDPNETLRLIVEAARAGDKDAYVQACDDLAEWLERGGFRPTVPEGTTYIPGTGTRWVLLSPLPKDRARSWELVRYDVDGGRVETHQLRGA